MATTKTEAPKEEPKTTRSRKAPAPEKKESLYAMVDNGSPDTTAYVVATELTDEQKLALLSHKILAVMEEVSYIEARGENKAQGYKYIKDSDLKKAINAALRKHKIAILPAVLGGEHHAFKKYNSGNESFVARITMQFTVVDSETGFSVSMPWVGQGADLDDKAEVKAITNGAKYFLKQLFQISSNEDDQPNAQPSGGRAAGKTTRRVASEKKKGTSEDDELKQLMKDCGFFDDGYIYHPIDVIGYLAHRANGEINKDNLTPKIRRDALESLRRIIAVLDKEEDDVYAYEVINFGMTTWSHIHTEEDIEDLLNHYYEMLAATSGDDE